MINEDLQKFSSPFVPDSYSSPDAHKVGPFFTNLDKSVYATNIFSPELIGAICSRTSRAAQDLRWIFLNEFIKPFINPERDEKDTDEMWLEKVKYGQAFGDLIEFLHKHPVQELFSNPRARKFYSTWLAQFGDDSIAQMAGMHLGYSSLSQVAIKHIEDQRIGLAPIEKSTRYVDYGGKIDGSYMYYTDPSWTEFGLEKEYRFAADLLFDTYVALLPRLIDFLRNKFPEEKPSVVEKKAFDCLRGLLPMSTLSQVAFFGNGQAFEYMINRCLGHHLGEIRWAGQAAFDELSLVAPSFLRRIADESKGNVMPEYQKYMAERGERVKSWVKLIEKRSGSHYEVISPRYGSEVRLLNYDPDGENEVITGILYDSAGNRRLWNEILGVVRGLTLEEKDKILSDYLRGRKARWQRVGRAFENAYVRFEIIMNNGAWRDLHRHRMHTQQRLSFSCFYGYDVPPEVIEAGLDKEFDFAIQKMEHVFYRIVNKDPKLAQYATTMAHRLPFMQLQNVRQFFWETELRTIPEGHPDYRHVEQEKFRLLEKVYPLIAKHAMVNMGEYDFARRGQEERIQAKLKRLE